MNYKDLQNQAKELGLPYVGVSRVELEKSLGKVVIPEVEITPENSIDVTEVKKEVEKPVKKSKPQEKREAAQEKAKVVEEPKSQPTDEPTAPVIPANYDVEVPADANSAIIYDGNYRVRTYSIDQHGEDFAELAKDYLKGHPKHRVEFKSQLPVLNCPNCGSKINCKKCGQEIS